MTNKMQNQNNEKQSLTADDTKVFTMARTHLSLHEMHKMHLP